MFQHPVQKAQYAPLLQALITLGENLLLSAALAILLAAAQYLSANQQINWPVLGYVCLVAGGLSVAHGLASFFIAKGYVPLGNALAADVDLLAQRLSAPAPSALPSPLTPVSAVSEADVASPPPVPVVREPQPLILMPRTQTVVSAVPPGQQAIPQTPSTATRSFYDTGVVPVVGTGGNSQPNQPPTG
jgi:hypothetical protein